MTNEKIAKKIPNPIFIVLMRVLFLFFLILVAVKADIFTIVCISFIYLMVCSYSINAFCRPILKKHKWLIGIMSIAGTALLIIYFYKLYQPALFFVFMVVIICLSNGLINKEDLIINKEEHFINDLKFFDKIKKTDTTIFQKIFPNIFVLVITLIVFFSGILVLILPNIIDHFFTSGKNIYGTFDFSNKLLFGSILLAITLFFSIMAGTIDINYQKEANNYVVYQTYYKWLLIILVIINLYMVLRFW